MTRRLAIVCTASAVIFAASLGELWWRLGAGPINLDIASQWLAAALEDNIGHGNTVEVGGTQIEREGRFRIALRIRDIIVRDRDHAIIARVPKAAVRLSGSALLRGRLRAESLTLLDAEISVRIAPDGYVTLSAGDNVRPLPDTFFRVTLRRMRRLRQQRKAASTFRDFGRNLFGGTGSSRSATASSRGHAAAGQLKAPSTIRATKCGYAEPLFRSMG